MHQTKIFALLFVVCVALSCANRGVGPQGGPKDETPPIIVEESPANGATNVRPKMIEITLNEYVQLDKVAENVLVSPPQKRPPKVYAVGKKVRVQFDEQTMDEAAKQDTVKLDKKLNWALKENTTYTINFGSAICDYTEKNPMESYTYAFSTGDVIDTMMMGGLMLNAEDLNPISGIIVGVYPQDTEEGVDTLFFTTPFERIGKTDAEGYFSLSNMRHGTYKVFGLADVSNDYFYQPGEGVALYDSLVTPTCYRDMVTDTLWRDSIDEGWREGIRYKDTIEVIDTIMTYEATIYEPQNLLLIFFKEDKQKHYFLRATREKQHFFTLTFAAPNDSLPIIKPIDADTTTNYVDWSEYMMIQANETKDTITVWLTDSLAMKQDTLAFEMAYLKSDSLFQLQPQIDTVRAIYRAPRISEKAKKTMTEKKPELNMNINGKNQFEIYNPLQCRFSTPVKTYVKDSLRLYQLVDTIRQEIPFVIAPKDSSYMLYEIRPLKPAKPEHNELWLAGTSYELEVDSAAFMDIYHVANQKAKSTFKIRTLEDYSTLRVKVEPYDERVVVQILDEKDNMVRQAPITPDGALFRHLAPKSYYFRIFIDWNGDGEWTTGSVGATSQENRQPEPVFYFSNKLTLRANWDFEETFRYLDKPIEKQKPDELKKDAGKSK